MVIAHHHWIDLQWGVGGVEQWGVPSQSMERRETLRKITQTTQAFRVDHRITPSITLRTVEHLPLKPQGSRAPEAARILKRERERINGSILRTHSGRKLHEFLLRDLDTAKDAWA